ncbi:MAG: YbjN domain-containing protein [Micrococcales bacterium]|nr:YbjN domain-containing protein [Micrococcales bacterium]
MELPDQRGGNEQASEVPTALSRERIEAALKAEGWSYQIDSDGDIGGMWDNNLFYFFSYGNSNEILQIRGRWQQALPIEYRNQVRQVLDDWHLTKIWPKAYTRVDDDGRLWVITEHSVDWEFGVTEQQLRLTLRCAITTSLSLYRELAKRFIVTQAEQSEMPEDWA